MNSFTSNFKQEAPVLGVVALTLLTCEIGLRVFGTSTSIDLQHIREIPQIVIALKNSPHPTLLFLGNSLTRRALIPDVLTNELAAQGISNIHIAKIQPDDSNIADWHYLYERFVRSMGGSPDILLVGFAEEQLSDSQGLHIERLGRYFGGLDAVSEAFHYDVQNFNDRISYLLANFSFAYANRDHVRTDLLGAVIPYYRTSAQVLNTAAKNRGEVFERRTPLPYNRLTRFLKLVQGSPTKVVFIAIPLPTLYPIDPALESVLSANGSRLIDLRQIDGLTPDDFLDGYHLSPQGGTVFTRELSRRLLNSGEIRSVLKKGAEAAQSKER